MLHLLLAAAAALRYTIRDFWQTLRPCQRNSAQQSFVSHIIVNATPYLASPRTAGGFSRARLHALRLHIDFKSIVHIYCTMAHSGANTPVSARGLSHSLRCAHVPTHPLDVVYNKTYTYNNIAYCCTPAVCVFAEPANARVRGESRDGKRVRERERTRNVRQQSFVFM